MPLPYSEFLALAAACAPSVPPQTLAPLIQVESAFNPLAINVNGEPRVQVKAGTPAEAVAVARRLIAQGRSLDLGLGQINSRNLAWLGISIEDAFDPCRNLAAAARVLQDGYGRAARIEADPQIALRTAFSFYNTGHPQRGYDNGYVTKVIRAARLAAMTPASLDSAANAAPPASPSIPAASPPAWDVFGRGDGGGFFVRRASPPPALALPVDSGDQP